MAHQIALGSLAHKQNCGETSPSKQMRKLKIQLADRIFQVKKMQEDFAQQKAHLLMQTNHQKNNLNSTIRELRAKLSQQNEHWANKINEMREQGKNLIQENNRYWRAKIEEQVLQKIQQMKLKYQIQIAELKKNVGKLNQLVKQKQRNYEKNLNYIKQTCKNQITELKQTKQQQIEEVKKKMIRDQQLKINAIMHIKNGQQKQHSNTKSLLLKRERQYSQTIKRLEEKIFQLNQQVWNLKNRNEILSSKNQEQNQHISKLEQIKISTVQMTSKQYEQKLEKSQQEWKQNLQSLNSKWKIEYKKVQLAYEKVSNACAEKEKLWQDRGNKVLKLYQSRQAREQDVKLIEHLEVQLIKKQFELERQKQQLKSCKLQLDNMDDIYKRIFNSVKKTNNRHSHSFQLKKMRLPGIMNRSTHPVKGQFY